MAAVNCWIFPLSSVAQREMATTRLSQPIAEQPISAPGDYRRDPIHAPLPFHISALPHDVSIYTSGFPHDPRGNSQSDSFFHRGRLNSGNRASSREYVGRGEPACENPQPPVLVRRSRYAINGSCRLTDDRTKKYQ